MADETDNTKYHLNIPVKVAASGIPASAALIYGVILSFWNTTKRPVNATDQYLADLLNVGERSIRRNISNLKDANQINIRHSMRSNGSMLRLIWPLIGENGESINTRLVQTTEQEDTQPLETTARVEVLHPKASPRARKEKIRRPNSTSAAELIGLEKWQIIGDALDEYNVIASEPQTRLLATQVYIGATPELVAEAIKQTASSDTVSPINALKLLTDWHKQDIKSVEQLISKD
ncbi:helix-turn-helix domain-containing protein [Weissella cibaria]|uniref:helix-turn-helix domain-containing protein n=1 Tax=Weissella cibaria TaxID=137591 RepID=UPI001D03F85A|nr:helix-turn-helix domain-containing protein [Weissella cibaria]MCB5826610.1 helix-turn-helix domain-containing protein [Weissella cibaria]MCB5858191.1 helix-turn-helix domain-containing protein [Weissella cibaria]MCB5861387.1 helix-turn-helix domain-containing protein [Weissella cibaria]MCB5862355.1 helix-turn-helix domain-containing protein [Weissella cibaria]MCB5865904.1 helix-turn-helix domain-containing protein [Weissella cibaria]